MPCYSPATRSSFVRLPDEFYVTDFNVAVACDVLRKYAVGYSLPSSAAAAGDLMSASSSSSARESSDFYSLASNA